MSDDASNEEHWNLSQRDALARDATLVRAAPSTVYNLNPPGSSPLP